jgi:hypothetical protein
MAFPDDNELIPTDDAVQSFNLFKDQKWLILKGHPLLVNLEDKHSALTTTQVELTLPSINDSMNNDIFLALHMPPKSDLESLQPFASSDDASALLEMNNAYEFIAKLKLHRRESGKRKKRCSDLLSLSSWQVCYVMQPFLMCFIQILAPYV